MFHLVIGCFLLHICMGRSMALLGLTHPSSPTPSSLIATELNTGPAHPNFTACIATLCFLQYLLCGLLALKVPNKFHSNRSSVNNPNTRQMTEFLLSGVLVSNKKNRESSNKGRHHYLLYAIRRSPLCHSY
jgi:hypothetical protein